MAPTHHWSSMMRRKTFSSCSAIARPSCRLPQLNVPYETNWTESDKITPSRWSLLMFSQQSERKLTRLCEDCAARMAFRSASSASVGSIKNLPRGAWAGHFGDCTLANSIMRLNDKRSTNESTRRKLQIREPVDAIVVWCCHQSLVDSKRGWTNAFGAFSSLSTWKY